MNGRWAALGPELGNAMVPKRRDCAASGAAVASTSSSARPASLDSDMPQRYRAERDADRRRGPTAGLRPPNLVLAIDKPAQWRDRRASTSPRPFPFAEPIA